MKFYWRWYLYVPDWADTRPRRCSRWLRRLFVRTVSATRVDVLQRGAGGAVTIFTVNRTTTMDYLLQRLPHERISYGNGSRIPNADLPCVLRERPADGLRIVACRREQDDLFEKPCWRVPDAVLSIIDLGDTESVRRQGNADNLRRIRNNGLYAAVSNDRKELEEFYHRAYVPQMRNRFGSLARPHSESTVIRAFYRGGLLWVLQDGIRLAGVVFSVSGSTLKSRVAAPVGDATVARRLRAVSATKKFLIDYAVERGFRRLDLGISRPQLLDGVLLHKKSWGARLVEAPDDYGELQVSWPVFTPKLAEWLYNSPLIVCESDTLAALTSQPESSTTEAFWQYLHRIWSLGIARIHVLGSRDDGISTVGDARVVWHSQAA